MKEIVKYILGWMQRIGNALLFLQDVFAAFFHKRIRWNEVLKQIYEQGLQSVVIIALTSLASGVVLSMQGYVAIRRRYLADP